MLSRWLRPSELIAAAAAAIPIGLLTGVVEFLIERNHVQLFLPIVSSLVSYVVVFCLLKLRPLTVMRIAAQPYMVMTTGIASVFENLQSAKSEMQAAFREAQNIDILLHRGLNEFGGEKFDMFSKILLKRLEANDRFEIRILHLDAQAESLSGKQALALRKNVDDWLRQVRTVRDFLEDLANKHSNIRVVGHHEPFIWRMFKFDDVMFVSGYVVKTNNDTIAPVFKIERPSGEAKSLYPVFAKYFQYLWDLYGSRVSTKPS